MGVSCQKHESRRQFSALLLLFRASSKEIMFVSELNNAQRCGRDICTVVILCVPNCSRLTVQTCTVSK